ncbi:uncharacterized protein LOC124357394 isoform X3 [Homalodisca vitripennis]|uniref:uncharacterized protein LOC124357394 isoform X3 n=1 Tax=Homalodisca vitripennis TaxID=197043 RepID=UPI001EE9EB75|nr:uncharacterized protein LOC124357394 isoform X3 [Homalodisca vitripennis]
MSEIAESFASSLSELTVNSKPHINMLTMLAEDHLEYAPIITQTVLTHLQKVRPDVKLPVLYLIDSIVKNVGKAYINLFTQSIVQSFTNTFEKVDEKTREQMFKLRQTWSEVFPAKTIYTLDKSVQQIDPAWPVSNPPPTVHLNPKFFKPDMLDSKSLTSTIIQQDIPHIESQSRHRKTKTYSPRNLSVTHSSRSKKVTPTSSTVVDSSKGVPAVAVVKPSQAPEILREQMIMKQKMILELQQKKLKLELLETQQQLQEQQKQLEKQSNNKTSAELSKLQQIVSQEEAKLKLMSKNLKKQIQMKLPKLQQIHKVTSDIKAQKVADVSKMSVVPESLVKPAALLELEKDEIGGKPLKTPTIGKSSAVTKEPKSKITQLQQTVERHKVVTPADSTEEIPPVRIAPVSSQLINAALSFGRNVRDPRIRQMSSRLESQLISTVAQSAPTPPHPSSTTTHPPPPTLPAPENKIDLKLRKDKKSNSHQHKERSFRSEEENKHNRLSSRSSDKSSTKQHEKLDKTSPSKRSERKNEKKLKVEDLFSSPRSKSPLQVKSLHSLSKSHSKRDQTNLTDTVEPSSSTSHLERVSKIESSPKRTKYHDNWQGVQSSDNSSDGCLSKQTQKLSLDVAKAQNIKQSESPKVSVSPEALDNSAEMLDEDIEKIVKHPDIVSKINKVAEVENIDESHESSKSSDDSIDGKFDEIIKNPTKTSKFEKLNKINDEKMTGIAITSGAHNNEKTKQSKEICSTSTLNNPIDSSQRIPYVDQNKIELQRTENLSISGQVKNTDSEEQNLAQSTNDPAVNSTSYVDENIQTSEPSVKEDSKRSEFQFSDLTSEQAEVSSTVNSVPEIQHLMSKEEINSAKAELSESDNLIFTNKDETYHVNSSSFEKTTEETQFIQTSQSPQNDFDHSEGVDTLQKLRNPDQLILSPRKVQSPIRNIEPMEIIEESNEDITSLVEFPLSKKSDKRRESPVHQERKLRKGDKPSIMEQIIADAEKHDASPSPPPPPIISDKFKEIKQSSLSRLRRVGRPREDLADAESPEPADVDLRTQIQPSTLPKDEVLGLADKDVDLRNLPVSPAKKRPSMEKLLDIPPAKKSKAEVMDDSAREVYKASVCKIRYFPARPDSTHWYNNSRICIYKRLFGSEDVDLRPVLCPPPPSPPPPPIISSSPPLDSPWARYKQTKPDTYKSKYVPSRRDRAPSVDKFARNSRFNSSEGPGSGGDSWYGRGSRTYQKDVDMRAQPPGNADGSFNTIIIQALEQHNRGDLNDDGYKRVLSEVFTMREKRQLEEAQRRDKAEAAQEAAQTENLEPISDEDISGGSLSGVEDAPSPTESYSGAEDFEDPSLKKPSNEKRKPVIERETKPSEKSIDVDIRVAPTDVDIRNKTDYQPVDEMPNRNSRGESPYSRKAKISDKDRYRSRRDELKAQRKEKRSRRAEEEIGSKYRNSRFNEGQWSPHEGRSISPTETMEVDAPRVPPIPHYDDGRNYREPPLTIHPPRFDKDFHPDQHDSPPVRPPVPWEPQRMAGPGPNPWMSGMGPIPRGPPVMGMRAQDRFIGPRWRQPGRGPNFEGEPGSRFNRFGPPPMGRFPVPLAPYEVPPTDPAVVKLIEEDPTKSINIDGLPRDIRFYGLTAVAMMSWDDPREVSFQTGQRRVIIDDRDSIIVHFNAPPVEVVIDGKPHRIRFGAPTRELYIDNKWYEVYFGGPPVTCDIAGKTHTVQLEGPPPPVRPGAQRKDLVVGKITLIIDAEYLFTVFLDARPQKFEVKGIPYIIRFVEALQRTVINGVAFKSDFGGLPRPIILNGSKHFFRLTALPRGVTPGFLTIVNMEGGRLPSPPTLPAPPQLPATLEQAVDIKPADPFLQPPMGLLTAPPRVSPEITNREVEPLPLHPPATIPPATVPLSIPPQTVQPTPAVNPLDMLSNLMPPQESTRAVDYSYSVDNENSNQSGLTTTTTTVTSTVSTLPSLTGEINVTELLQKLMAKGIMPTLEQPKDKTPEKAVTTDSGLIKPVDFRKHESLKVRQTGLIAHLYSGIQCNSCGVRFPPEQTMKYSQHLDWHFRQNRRDKDSSRMAQTRRYYYDVSDWIQFEEIEDLEERAQPWFEMQEGAVEEEDVPRVLVSVRAADYPEDAVCHICHDKFESFYNEEKEEWHLRNAEDNNGQLVHPVCLEDQRAAAEKPIVVEDIDITGDEPKEEEKETDEKKEEEEPPKVEEDDDIMEVTDIEYIKPVFPVEDLTVSDSESVVDNSEEKPELVETEMESEEKISEEEVSEVVQKEEVKDNDNGKAAEGETELEKTPAEELKDEDTQDDLMLILDKTDDSVLVMDKKEDSVLSTEEILEVVRNIKKDPDTLGGEYEEDGLVSGIDIKKEKGEVPLPAPVVDTTHATVTCLIDGNVEFEETPQQMNIGGPPKIKINITKSSVQPKEKENELEIVESESSNTTLPATLSLFTQPPPPGEEPVPQSVKPLLRKQKLQEMPPVLKGSEMSGLCSIM